MSFVATTNPDGKTSTYTELDLPAARSVTIPTLCFGLILHDVRISSWTSACTLWLVRAPGAFLTHHLLIDQGPITLEGPLMTVVFNLTNKPFRVRSGDVLSRLISLRLE